MAELNQERNSRIKNAFGISPFFVEGSSFDPNRKAKEELAKSESLNKKYSIIEEPPLTQEEIARGEIGPRASEDKTSKIDKSSKKDSKKRKHSVS